MPPVFATFYLATLLLLVASSQAFAPSSSCSLLVRCRRAPSFLVVRMAPEDSEVDDEGKDLAAQFFKLAQERNIGLDDDDLLDDDDEDEDDEEGVVMEVEESEDDDDDEEEVNIPQGAINAFLGWDSGDVGDKLAGNVTLTNDQIYGEVKERVLDTAGGFVELVGSASDDEEIEEEEKPKEYKPPTTVPDSDLTAGEVVLLVLDALLHNDVPTKNRGVEILFGYSSAGSSIKNEIGLTPDEYAEFLKETEYKVLFNHYEVFIDKGDYSYDGRKAFFTARLRIGPKPIDLVNVNFILSTLGNEEDDCWLIDSMLIRPESMRRRRRR